MISVPAGSVKLLIAGRRAERRAPLTMRPPLLLTASAALALFSADPQPAPIETSAAEDEAPGKAVHRIGFRQETDSLEAGVARVENDSTAHSLEVAQATESRRR